MSNNLSSKWILWGLFTNVTWTVKFIKQSGELVPLLLILKRITSCVYFVSFRSNDIFNLCANSKILNESLLNAKADAFAMFLIKKSIICKQIDAIYSSCINHWYKWERINGLISNWNTDHLRQLYGIYYGKSDSVKWRT